MLLLMTENDVKTLVKLQSEPDSSQDNLPTCIRVRQSELGFGCLGHGDEELLGVQVGRSLQDNCTNVP